MNKLLGIILIVFILTGMNSCLKRDVLNQSPENEISDELFWNSSSDLKLFANSFYQQLSTQSAYLNVYEVMGIYTLDQHSDNMIAGIPDDRLNGRITVPGSSDEWGYGRWAFLRDINTFIVNYGKVDEGWDAIRQYVGEAYFFRAMFYFDKLKSFGDLPWINKPLEPSDSAYLSYKRISRHIIADSILADLDKAIDALFHKSNTEDKMRICREYAQGFASRVALYEGTWEKYHQDDVFGVDGHDGTEFLQRAYKYAQEVMNSGEYSLDNVGQKDGYFNLFNQFDYSDSKEVMFWREFKYPQVTQHWERYLSRGGREHGITKKLVDSYLCTDGKPISESPLYEGDNTLQKVVKDRDPRLRQSIYLKGDLVWSGSSYPTGQDFLWDHPFLVEAYHNLTGYQIRKGHVPDYNVYQEGTGIPQAALIYMRYGEVLLNFAEAKAELGEITQTDLDNSINLLRDRVNMPHLNFNSITVDPNWNFPDLSPIINEVRRERRVELALEGFRLDDILRWAAVENLIRGWRPLGAKFKQWEDIYPNAISDGDIYVNPEGYIDPYRRVPSMDNGYRFDIGRDYLLPISTEELTLNPNIEQNPGW